MHEPRRSKTKPEAPASAGADDLHLTNTPQALSDWVDFGPPTQGPERHALTPNSVYALSLMNLQAATDRLCARVAQARRQGRPTTELEAQIEVMRAEMRSLTAYLRAHAGIRC